MHDQQSTESQVHLPQPSVWPLAVGAAALVAGLALVWWTGDRSSQQAGIAIGVAIAVMLAAVAGWVWEDSRLRRDAAQADGRRRVEQVMSFTLVSGHPDESALMSAIDDLAEQLRGDAGLEDVRVLRSGHDGRIQVLIETTWESQQALESFDATRRTFLDVLLQWPGAVEAGSVQAFNMEVELETKDLTPRFNIAAAATVLASLLVGGTTLAAGISLFGNGEAGAPVGPDRTATPVADFVGIMVEERIRFLTEEFVVPPRRISP